MRPEMRRSRSSPKPPSAEPPSDPPLSQARADALAQFTAVCGASRLLSPVELSPRPRSTAVWSSLAAFNDTAVCCPQRRTSRSGGNASPTRGGTCSWRSSASWSGLRPRHLLSAPSHRRSLPPPRRPNRLLRTRATALGLPEIGTHLGTTGRSRTSSRDRRRPMQQRRCSSPSRNRWGGSASSGRSWSRCTAPTLLLEPTVKMIWSTPS